ncbi:MAG: L,D-transpeptidase, partial [Sandaracinaceae bacterium]
GWLRLGGRVRLKAEGRPRPGCASGWYEIAPRGWVCAGLGVEVSEAPPEAPEGEEAAATDQALPYRYLVVREPQVPEYHRLPSRDEQRAALAHAERYVVLLNDDLEARAERLRAGELEGREPRSPAVVSRYLQRGFYVAATGVEVRAFRRFVRTVRGSYLKEAQLIERTGADFHGVALGDGESLPIAWAVRAARPMERIVRADGTERFRELQDAEPYERQARVPWLRRDRFGSRVMHVLEGERYLRAWFVTVAERIDPPSGVAADEPWVHVDLGEQTLVLYRGPTPVYATLVSTGVDEHDTPTGEYRIRRKLVSDTMADLGDTYDDAYRIEDVPWTQYFEGSFALHGAFWHGRFGLRRSHGCVNLAPTDARAIFQHTWPQVPEGWHGVSTEGTAFEGSRVLVTE